MSWALWVEPEAVSTYLPRIFGVQPLDRTRRNLTVSSISSGTARSVEESPKNWWQQGAQCGHTRNASNDCPLPLYRHALRQQGSSARSVCSRRWYGVHLRRLVHKRDVNPVRLARPDPFTSVLSFDQVRTRWCCQRANRTLCPTSKRRLS